MTCILRQARKRPPIRSASINQSQGVVAPRKTCSFEGVAAQVGLPVLLEVSHQAWHNEIRVCVGRNLAQRNGRHRQDQQRRGQSADDGCAQTTPAIGMRQRPNTPPQIPCRQNEDRVVMGQQHQRREQDKGDVEAEAGERGLGTGDWGLGIGDRAFGHARSPDPRSPVPNPSTSIIFKNAIPAASNSAKPTVYMRVSWLSASQKGEKAAMAAALKPAMLPATARVIA